MSSKRLAQSSPPLPGATQLVKIWIRQFQVKETLRDNDRTSKTMEPIQRNPVNHNTYRWECRHIICIIIDITGIIGITGINRY